MLITGALFPMGILRLELPFLLPCVVLWTAYAGWRLLRERGLARAWGLDVRSVRPALPACAAFFGLASLGILGYRLLALFGLAHAPNWRLAALCAVAGLAWSGLFLRGRSRYPLAVSHAWLGVLVYYWALERDPWIEVFSRGRS